MKSSCRFAMDLRGGKVIMINQVILGLSGLLLVVRYSSEKRGGLFSRDDLFSHSAQWCFQFRS